MFKNRSTQIRAAARLMDMQYFERAPYKEFAFLEIFRLFQNRRSQQIRNILSVEEISRDILIDIFDFSYAVDDNRVYQTVHLIQNKKMDLPPFMMRPAHLGDRFAELFIDIDIDFELWPRFSRNYVVKGKNESTIRYMMNDPFLEYFNSRPGWTLEGFKDLFLIYRRRKRVNPDDLPSFHEFSLEVHDLIIRGGGERGYV
jgi:hypothetical protein